MLQSKDPGNGFCVDSLKLKKKKISTAGSSTARTREEANLNFRAKSNETPQFWV